MAADPSFKIHKETRSNSHIVRSSPVQGSDGETILLLCKRVLGYV